jgi:hypothetical protein
MRSLPPSLALLALAAACRSSDSLSERGDWIAVERAPAHLSVSVGGRPFTEYWFSGSTKPWLYPLLSPSGLAVTRGFPMEELPHEARDHPHHRSLWFAHGAAGGFDFWHQGDERVEHLGFDEVTEGRGRALVRSRNAWRAPDGTVVCLEQRRMEFLADGAVGPGSRGEPPSARAIDFEVTLVPQGRDLLLGDTKEGTMALRLAPTLRLKGQVGQGRILNSEGQRDGECWGRRGRWVGCWGPVGGRPVSVALLDHPTNPSHPTWWHARDYGLIAANPFGVHDFEGLPAGTGDRVVPLGESITFRYRVAVVDQPGTPELFEELWAAFAGR